MTREQMIALAEAWFHALDATDPAALAALVSEDCTLVIETHGQRHAGRAAIAELFATRWREAAVTARHHDFVHTADPGAGRVASQFTVTYTGADAPPPKSNANVFTLRDGRIAAVQVYMAGANTIRA